jgi:hypothetical protein
VPRKLWSFITVVIVVMLGVAERGQSAAGPLQLLLECSQTSEVTFRVTLQNVSSSPTAVVIGMVLANDRKYLLKNLVLRVRREGAADTLLQYFDPSAPAAIAGRVDPWLVTLPPGSSYSIPVLAKHFASPPTYTAETFSTPADVQLQLTTQEMATPNSDLQGLRLIHVWVGTLSSNWIAVPASCGR